MWEIGPRSTNEDNKLLSAYFLFLKVLFFFSTVVYDGLFHCHQTWEFFLGDFLFSKWDQVMTMYEIILYMCVILPKAQYFGLIGWVWQLGVGFPNSVGQPPTWKIPSKEVLCGIFGIVLQLLLIYRSIIGV